jgi:heme-degrading monooxygenase HmoA
MVFKSFFMGLSVLMFTSCSQHQLPKVAEVAIYRISAEKQGQFTSLLTQFKGEVQKLQGFEDYVTLQDKSNERIFVDLLHWHNLNDAVSASEKVKIGSEFKPFTSSIDSLVFYGDFILLNSFSNNSQSSAMANNIKEVVVYQLKSDKVAAYPEIIKLVNLFLSKREGFINREVLQDHKDKTIFMDIVTWDNVVNAQNAMEASQKEASIIPFFEATEKVISFSHCNHFQ